MTLKAALGALAVASLLGACATPQTDRQGSPPAPAAQTAAAAGALPAPRIVSGGRRLQCVPYARSITNLAIRGDAWTWWGTAAGRYRRDGRPAVGAVLVLKRTKRLRYGHIAVVSRIVSRREILVDHANWLNRGRIHKNLPVRDVSPANDWSAVRVWYAPGNTLGARTYPAHGFIHPREARSIELRRPPMQGPDVNQLQEALAAAGYPLAPDGVFGPASRAALIAYQRDRGLVGDGVAGPETRANLGL